MKSANPAEATRTAQDSKNAAPYRSVLALLKPYRFLITASVLLSAATVALTVYLPVLVGRTIDLLLGPGQVKLDAVCALLLQIAAIAGLTALVQWLVTVLNNRVAYQVTRDLRKRAFRHMQHLPLSYLDRHSVGELVSRMITDVDQFADGLLLGFTQLFTGVMTILGTLAFMVSIRPLIAGIVLVLTPLSIVVARFIASHTHNFFVAQSQTRGEQTALVDELLGGQKVVKAFGRELAAVAAFDAVNDRLETNSLKAVFYSSLTNPCTRFVNSVVYAAVVLSGALLCVATAGTAAPFTVGSLSALLAYANQYTKPFNEISGVVTEFQNALACAGRVFALLEEPLETETPEAVHKGRQEGDLAQGKVSGTVQMDDVSFSYTKEKPLIEHLSFLAQPGQRIAIVGPTGCGKTTLINLLMRFYDVDSGAIRVDGSDLRDMTRARLRASYGMVLQETWLRSGTIRDNLILGKPEATDEEIEAACRAAHAHSFIQLLPRGYDTVITEDGGMLSQGQKQLLCIARIMLCLPPMLILDEATSSIDTRTEMKIQKAFATMMQGRTSFIVAHRLSTIREADAILVMKEGKVIEVGTHDELLSKRGFYAELYNSQFSG